MILSRLEEYSKYIRFTNILFDVLAITLLFPVFLQDPGLNPVHFTTYLIFFWGFIAYFLGYYEVYRYTSIMHLCLKTVKQAAVFFLALLAFFIFSKHTHFNAKAITLYFFVALSATAVCKIILFYIVKKQFAETGAVLRKTIIAGYTAPSKQLKEVFKANPERGIRFCGFFSDKHSANDVLGRIEDIKEYALQNDISEIYCSLSEVSLQQMKSLITFAEQQDIVVKFIPDARHIFYKNLRIDHHEFFPVLSLRKTVLHEPAAQFIKRFFDIIFSLFVIMAILSWLTPLLALLIKLESKGPVFFKQSRPGLNEKEFFCYKFRSMQINETTEQSVIKNDPRVTRIGRFIRKTSIDEMPQFINVLRGEMSVVGPRPHLWAQNNAYSQTIGKYMIRLYVRPGITGLAQVRGFRGEISTDVDMINRIKYDVFYIENWSLLLDINVIIQTVVNIFLGDEKAY